MLPTNLSDEQLAAFVNGATNAPWIDDEDTGPGKFEGNSNPGLASRLYDATLEGWCDDQVGSVDENGWWAGLLGRFIVSEDNQGFFDYEEFHTCAEAERAFRKLDPYGDA